MITKDFTGQLEISLLMEEASLSLHRPVIVHAWFLATDRALGALFRLWIRRTTQARIGTSSIFCHLFYGYWEDGFFSSSCSTSTWSLSREGNRSKPAAMLLLPGCQSYFSTSCSTSTLFCCVYCLALKGGTHLPRLRTFVSCFPPLQLPRQIGTLCLSITSLTSVALARPGL